MNAPATLTVLVADNHPVYLDGLVDAFSVAPGIAVACVCTDGETALGKIRELEPRVAVLDMRMPELDAWEILERIRDEGLPTRVLVLSAYTDPDLVARAFQAGAAGYLTKDTDRDEICQAVRRVAAGATVMGPEIQEVVAAHLQSSDPRSRSPLTDREQQVLGLLAESLSVRQIGDRLFVSAATVKTHLQHVYEKLGVSERAAAVAEAMRRGLLR